MRVTRAYQLAGAVAAASTALAFGLQPSAAAATTPPPAVQSVTPANGASVKPTTTNGTGQTVQTPVTATFDRSVNPSTSYIQVLYDGAPIKGSSSVNTNPAPLGNPDEITFTTTWSATPATYTAHAHAVDASNAGLVTDYFWSFTIDGVAPKPPVLQQSWPEATGANDASYPVTGTAEPLAKIVVAATDGSSNTVYGSANAAKDGSFSVPVNLSGLSDGSISLSVTATDAAGNVSAAATATVTKDATPPPAPTINPPPMIDASNQRAYAVSGTIGSTLSPPPADLNHITVVATDQSGLSVSGSVAKAQVSGTSWSVTLDLGSLTDQQQVKFVATAYDNAGNAASGAPAYAQKNVATFAVTANHPVIDSHGFPPDVVSETFSHTLQQQTTTSTLGQVTANGSTISLSHNGVGLQCTPGFSSDGHTIFCTPPSPLQPSSTPYTVSVDAYDQYTPQGHLAPSTANDTVFNFYVAVSGVTAAFTSNPIDGSNQSAVKVGGTGVPGQPVSLTFSSTGGGTAMAVPADERPTVDGNGNWSTSVDLGDLPDGTVSVTAVEADASGTSKSATAQVTKHSMPSAPLNVVAVPGDDQATVSWDPPSYTGNSPITGYRVTSSDGQVQQVQGTSAVVSGLTNGASYTFSVAALTQAVPTGGPAATSNAVTPRYTTRLTIGTTRSYLNYGTATTLYGRLTRVDTGYGIGGVTLTVVGRYDNGRTVLVGRPTTNSVGAWWLGIRPAHNMSIWAIYPGTSSDARADSWAVYEHVQALVRVTSPTNGSTTRVGTNLVITGNVLPNFAGRYVQLWAYYNGTHRVVQQTLLNKYSQYAFRVNLRAGSYLLRVVILNPPYNTTGASGYLRCRRV